MEKEYLSTQVEEYQRYLKFIGSALIGLVLVILIIIFFDKSEAFSIFLYVITGGFILMIGYLGYICYESYNKYKKCKDDNIGCEELKEKDDKMAKAMLEYIRILQENNKK
jgi:hypothetical protein